MDQLNDKQRQIIRLAFTSKDPELRRRAVEKVVTARYTEEFKEWANSQGAVFTRPDTGNQVRFNSLESQEQKEVYRRYEGGDYEDKGGPAAPGGGEDSGGDRDQGADDSGGGQHANRKELRGKGKKSMEDDAGMNAEALGKMFPVEKLEAVEDEEWKTLIQDTLLNGDLSYGKLEALQMTLQYMAENPDKDYTKNHWLTKHAKLDQGELKKLNKALGKKLQDAKGRKYSSTVLGIANSNNLEGVDADAIHAFRVAKPARGKKLTPEQLKQKFLQGPWGDAETKKRVREMDANEFMAMRNAIFDEDDEEGLSFDVAASTKSTLSLFDLPPGSEDTDKEASLTKIGRKIVRMAFNSKDPEVRRKLVRRARAETTS